VLLIWEIELRGILVAAENFSKIGNSLALQSFFVLKDKKNFVVIFYYLFSMRFANE
jgi:hypothetical protein